MRLCKFLTARGGSATAVLFLFSLLAAARAQTSGSDPQPRVFRGTTDSCIFNDGSGAAQNCFTGTATFLSAPPPSRPGFYNPAQRLRAEDVTFTGAGLDIGGGDGGWTLQQGEYRLVTSYTRGITQNLNLVTHCRRIGDCANYFYLEHDGGVAATGDEAAEALAIQANESATPYVGKVTETSGSGDQQPRISGAADQWVTDGGMLLDITSGTLQGELAGTSDILGNYLVRLRLTTEALPKSSAWGTIVAGYDKPTTLANVSLPVTVDVTLGAISGRQLAFKPGPVCVAGPSRFEQAVLELPAAGERLPVLKAGHQWLRLHVRYPNAAYTSDGQLHAPILFQGGVCGQYVSADADLAFSHMRTTYPAFGSLTGSDLITAKQVAGVMKPYLPQVGSQAWTASGEHSHFHLYPGAEIVANTRLTPQLEPNTVPWKAGDQIESPHGMTVAQNVLFVVDQQASPTDQSFGGSGFTLILTGKGIAAQHKGIFLVNQEDKSSYTPYGGPLVPPHANYFQGQFNDLQHVVNAPNGALAGVTYCNAAGKFSLFDLPNLKNDHAVKVDYDCASGRISLPRLATTAASVSDSLQRGGSEVCTEDGKHCPGMLPTTVAVPALPAGACQAYTAQLRGLKDSMIISASARSSPGLVTTSTYFAGPDRAGLVVCSPAGPSQATVYNVSAR